MAYKLSYNIFSFSMSGSNFTEAPLLVGEKLVLCTTSDNISVWSMSQAKKNTSTEQLQKCWEPHADSHQSLYMYSTQDLGQHIVTRSTLDRHVDQLSTESRLLVYWYRPSTATWWKATDTSQTFHQHLMDVLSLVRYIGRNSTHISTNILVET